MQLRNTSSGEIIQLSDGLTLGRNPDCGFVLADSSVSRVHAKIEWHNSAFVLNDQQSSNGCFVDGRRQSIIRLRCGAFISLGEIEFEVVDESAASASASATADYVERAQQRREIIAEPSSGFGDLSQQPFIIRALALFLGIGVMLSVIYLVRKAGELF
ncbi:MAG: FHA domain-containing protein [Planctomycetes bacterium]|nr:FHA domain-containing protein [Planctomycetota bacterium]